MFAIKGAIMYNIQVAVSTQKGIGYKVNARKS